MAEILEQLRPIADIVGPTGVKAFYSDHQLGNPQVGYRPGWRIEIDATYKGAEIKFSNKATTLDEAASKTLLELKTALGV